MTDPRLAIFKQLLLAWNEKINLIGPGATKAIDAHIDEALRAAELLEPVGEVLDFGSGGGLPAIPMAIAAPAAHFHLVEADQKKWAFLKRAVRECGLNAQIHGDRLARILPRLPADLRLTLVTSRAVGRPEEWLPSLKPFLSRGSKIGLFQRGSSAPAIAGFDVAAVEPLPRGTGNSLVTLMFHVEQ